MKNYVTLFDSNYLPQGMALYFSMKRNLRNFQLWIICIDVNTYNLLTKLNFENVKLINLLDVETEELKKIKKHRSKVEYCWTLTPFAPKFVFDIDKLIKRITYIDADIWFMQSDETIVKDFESSGKSVLITDHSYSAEFDMSYLSGKYCVQYIIFEKNGSKDILKKWQKQCIKWCFARHEDGKFGDQKYLDTWPLVFSKLVYILQNKELILAPWNAFRFPYGNSVCWHFHSLKIVEVRNRSLLIDYGTYPLPLCVKKYVYEPYINDLIFSIKILIKYKAFSPQKNKLYFLVRILRHIKQIYNRIKNNQSYMKVKI
ncbi:hypothetical protein MCEET85_00837 [Candidatus Methylopumilus planktonicus]|uniref:glycosyl transferase n=1 Tax=Candidatus Methylopumilus planktonicus TaxID=1581557 RepID=UPI003BEF3A99